MTLPDLSEQSWRSIRARLPGAIYSLPFSAAACVGFLAPVCIFWRKHGTCFNVLGTSSATKKNKVAVWNIVRYKMAADLCLLGAKNGYNHYIGPYFVNIWPRKVWFSPNDAKILYKQAPVVKSWIKNNSFSNFVKNRQNIVIFPFIFDIEMTDFFC